MDKELRTMLDGINAKKDEVRALVAEKKLDEAESSKKELIKMQKAFDLTYDLEDEADAEIKAKIKSGEKEMKRVDGADGERDSVKAFAEAARLGFRGGANAMMTSGSKESGGYTVPEDIRTRIEKYRETKESLASLVKIEPVTTETGARTFKKRSQQTGFVKVGEGGKIPRKDTPKFERLTYAIKKYAGFFPVTSELLADSDANIVETLIEWIGDESRVTRNKLILEIINEKETTEFTTLDDIKDTINVTLGAAFKNTSFIITNDDGFNYFDKLKNSDGDYLMQPLVTDPTQHRIFGLFVKVINNADMPSEDVEGGKSIPIIIGDLKEGVVMFDRKQLSILSSEIAVADGLNAYEEDLELWRAIEREDVVLRDEQAFVNGRLTVLDVPVAPASMQFNLPAGSGEGTTAGKGEEVLTAGTGEGEATPDGSGEEADAKAKAKK